MKKIATYAKKQEQIINLEKRLLSLLNDDFIIDQENPDIVISIGGDGTFLRAVHHFIKRGLSPLFVGVNAGHLGFFSNFESDELELLVSYLKGEDKYNEHALIEAQIDDLTIYAVNEIRIENPFHTLISDVYVNDEILETFRGNGLVLSSSLGSTAYNKSLGGAIIDESLDLLQLTEIASISNSAYHSLCSSYVLPINAKVDFTGNFVSVVVGYDFETFHLENAKKITMRLSDKKVKILNYKNKTYITKLKESFLK